MFYSEYAPRIWDTLYDVSIPDIATQNSEYLKKFGVRVTGVRAVDDMLANNFTRVKIPIISIVTYYNQGIPIQIPKREDMIQMHKDIGLYLSEWKTAMVYDVNLMEIPKDLLDSLDKFSKYIHSKATATELVKDKIESMRFGLSRRLDPVEVTKPTDPKPDYEGIGRLIRQKSQRY